MIAATISEATGVQPGKYLTLLLDGESYAISVRIVREIIRLPRITRVPELPAYVSGVINLRGRVIAVLDLRAQLGLSAATSERTCVIVISARFSQGGASQLGLVVDAVEEVLNITADEIAPPPEFGRSIDARYLRGLAKLKGKVTMLLDLEGVIGADPLDHTAAPLEPEKS